MEVLTFPRLVEGRFLKRLNRFIAEVEIGGERKRAHIHDPGRLSELLVPGAEMLLLPKRGRRTDYHAIAVWREGYGWVFIHSGYHSLIAQKLIEARALPEFTGLRGYAREVRVEDHRVDFALIYESPVLAEVKGCTLFRGDLALFPDAPTKRGREHVEILAKSQPSMVLFLVMTDRIKYFMPNWDVDPSFASTLVSALGSGVHVTALTFSFDGCTLHHVGRVTVLTGPKAKKAAKSGAEAVETYNERFGPESLATLVAASKDSVWVLFHGFACVLCGLLDYFEDFAGILGAWLSSFRRVGAAHVARFVLP